MPEAATGGVQQKKVFFKMMQSSQETPVLEDTSLNFAKFLRISFLQKNSGRLLVKCGQFNNKARDINCISCKELDAMLYCFGYGSISPSSFYGNLLNCVPCVLKTCLRDNVSDVLTC